MTWYVEMVTQGKREVGLYSDDFATYEEALDYAKYQQSLGFTVRIKQS
jgi:hypothetical protein